MTRALLSLAAFSAAISAALSSACVAKEISQYPSADTLTGQEVFVLDQAAGSVLSTRKTTLQTVEAFIAQQLATQQIAAQTVHVRTITAAGPVTILPTDKVVNIAKTTSEATIVNYTCTPNFWFVLKDSNGVDASFPITPTPSSGTLDGAPSFALNTSTPGAPPYDSHTIICDENGVNAGLY